MYSLIDLQTHARRGLQAVKSITIKSIWTQRIQSLGISPEVSSTANFYVYLYYSFFYVHSIYVLPRLQSTGCDNFQIIPFLGFLICFSLLFYTCLTLSLNPHYF